MSHPSSSSSSSSSKHNLPPPASTSVSASPSSTDLYLPDPPRDLISSIVFTPTATTDINTDPIDVLISSWDHHVHHYRIHPTSLKSASTSIYDALHKQQTFAHQAPVLDVCFITSHLAASACVDRRVRLLDLATGKTLILGKHDDSVLKLRYCPQTNLLISGSADRTLKIWNVALNHSDASIDISGFSNNGLLKTLQMPDKVIAMDISPPYSCFNNASEPTLIYSASTPGKATPRDSTPRLVVAMAARHVYVYDLLPLKTTIQKEAQGQEVKARDWQPDQKRESSLKFMARDLRCMPAGDGYVMSSVEGRVAVEFFDPSAKIQAGKYAFKCHRHTVTTTHPQREQDDMVQDNDHGRDDLEMPYDIVYPVHAVAFHPT
nr:related to mitotic checkpoint protein BUB3 [Melanopsichium pennsylvanicum 4]